MSFPFVQFEFAFPLGPADGRYLRRVDAGDESQRVLVLRTLGAPPRRLLRGRRPRRVERAQAAAVPTIRATVIRAQAFATPDDAARWLARMRSDTGERAHEVADAAAALSFMLRAHRASAADPYARDVVADKAIVVRIGYGSGDQVADGRFIDAYELADRPPRGRRRAELLAPQERLAAILSGRDSLRPAAELVLRARADVDAGRPREAALQARIALEALLADLGEAGAELESHRPPVAEAANAALSDDPPQALSQSVAAAVDAMDRAVRRAALRSP